MIIVTADTIEGKKIVKIYGLVKGNSIRARHIGHDIMAGFKNIVVELLAKKCCIELGG